jgi:hypothetical protein
MSRSLLEELIGLSDLADNVVRMMGIKFQILEDFITYDEIDKMPPRYIFGFTNKVIRLILNKWSHIFSVSMYIFMCKVAAHRRQLRSMILLHLQTYITKDIMIKSGCVGLLGIYIAKYWASSPEECVNLITNHYILWYEAIVTYPMNRDIFDNLLLRFPLGGFSKNAMKSLLQNNQIYVDQKTIDRLRDFRILSSMIDVIPMHIRFRLEK